MKFNDILEPISSIYLNGIRIRWLDIAKWDVFVILSFLGNPKCNFSQYFPP